MESHSNYQNNNCHPFAILAHKKEDQIHPHGGAEGDGK